LSFNHILPKGGVIKTQEGGGNQVKMTMTPILTFFVILSNDKNILRHYYLEEFLHTRSNFTHPTFLWGAKKKGVHHI